MPIEMPRGLPFSVDTFGPYTTKKRKRHHFLTHAHTDHTAGISVANAVFPIYSTSLTISLLLQRHPKLDASLFVSVEVGQSACIDDPDGKFKVTAFDANHCPGAVMFLFEGNFGNILHTGDCRLTSECLQTLPERYVGRQGKAPQCCLDYIFLDCTFGKFSRGFPSKHSAIRQIINCIWRHPDAPIVYLACDLLGQEDVLVEVYRTFGTKIYVDKATNHHCFRSLMVTHPEIVSEDPSSRFHIFDGFPKLCERASAKLAEARYNLQPEPIIIRPSAQWFVCDEDESPKHRSQSPKRRRDRFNEALRDEFGIWHVCYSIHSSQEELESALQLLSPKWVVSTTPFCRAMELDYVRKNCLVSRLGPDDPLWLLLDIDVQCSSPVSCCPMIEEHSQQDYSNSQLEPVIESSSMKKRLSLSTDKSLPVTLFGRARLGLEESDRSNEKRTITNRYDEYTVSRLNMKEVVEPLQDVTNERRDGVEPSFEEVNDDRDDAENSTADSGKESWKGFSPCKNLSKNLRKLYRSMNAPVPRPLPSLVEIMNARKRARKHLVL
ncbi:PREDICTED: 5' exonuclease Apollo [Tarenaya hassleriana]|uniref:5' exonuclease Apollo n=1 Tax=Tarenaya hassleriana TaxID=28532 RepID=UPI00053C971C|nr:PREDICTED: 5' exonuclease Apollo [Tarenaya hassleriana]